MYSSVDFDQFRPLYRSDGLKTFDVHANPLSIRDQIKMELGISLPLSGGPGRLPSSKWIADSARWMEEVISDLSLVYLPHLDYDLQLRPDSPQAEIAIQELDRLTGELLDFTNPAMRVYHTFRIWTYPGQAVIYPNRALRLKGC